MKKILVVGGYARDLYLGLPLSNDMDFVVVGMTEEEFLEEYPEARQVGKSFPCYKSDGEDFAFARTERSTGPGPDDFVVEFNPMVTLEDDLNRRDFTINTACVCPETGEFYLLAQAKADLDEGVLRHVSAAFREDPLRVFRLARFAAKFPHFCVARETFQMCQSMTDMLPSVTKERVSSELIRALSESDPAGFFFILAICDGLTYWFREFFDLVNVPAGPKEYHTEYDTLIHSLNVLKEVSKLTDNPITRWAAVCHDLGKGLTPRDLLPAHHDHDKRGVVQVQELCGRLGLPKIFEWAAQMACEEHMRFNKLCGMRPGKAVALLHKLNRFPGGIEEFIKLVKADGINPGVEELAMAAQAVFQLKLPEIHQNRGEISGEILLEMRARAFKKIKEKLNVKKA